MLCCLKGTIDEQHRSIRSIVNRFNYTQLYSKLVLTRMLLVLVEWIHLTGQPNLACIRTTLVQSHTSRVVTNPRISQPVFILASAKPRFNHKVAGPNPKAMPCPSSRVESTASNATWWCIGTKNLSPTPSGFAALFSGPKHDSARLKGLKSTLSCWPRTIWQGVATDENAKVQPYARIKGAISWNQHVPL